MIVIEEFPSYSITKDGKVWSHLRNKWLKPSKDNKGYLQVILCKNGKMFSKKIHALVLSSFVSPRPERRECRHLDGNKLNNKLENLQWGTSSENRKDSIKHGTANCIKCGEGSPHHKLTEGDVRTIIYVWGASLFTQREIAVIYNISITQTNDIINKKSWKHIWKEL